MSTKTDQRKILFCKNPAAVLTNSFICSSQDCPYHPYLHTVTLLPYSFIIPAFHGFYGSPMYRYIIPAFYGRGFYGSLMYRYIIPAFYGSPMYRYIIPAFDGFYGSPMYRYIIPAFYGFYRSPMYR